MDCLSWDGPLNFTVTTGEYGITITKNCSMHKEYPFRILIIVLPIVVAFPLLVWLEFSKLHLNETWRLSEVERQGFYLKLASPGFPGDYIELINKAKSVINGKNTTYSFISPDNNWKLSFDRQASWAAHTVYVKYHLLPAIKVDNGNLFVDYVIFDRSCPSPGFRGELIYRSTDLPKLGVVDGSKTTIGGASLTAMLKPNTCPSSIFRRIH